MRTRKLTTWMHSHIDSLYPYGMHPSQYQDRLAFARAGLRERVALKHSSKRRPIIMTIIHARINARTPGSMLAARHAGYVG